MKANNRDSAGLFAWGSPNSGSRQLANALYLGLTLFVILCSFDVMDRQVRVRGRVFDSHSCTDCCGNVSHVDIASAAAAS